jgi:hypothetical protein
MIVVPALVEFEDGLAGFEVVTGEEARLLELRQHAVDRGEADVEAFRKQLAIDVLRGEMADFRRLERLMILGGGTVALSPALLVVQQNRWRRAPWGCGGAGAMTQNVLPAGARRGGARQL